MSIDQTLNYVAKIHSCDHHKWQKHFKVILKNSMTAWEGAA